MLEANARDQPSADPAREGMSVLLSLAGIRVLRVIRGKVSFPRAAGLLPVPELQVFHHKYVEHSMDRKPGALAGRVCIAPDFDELPPDIARAFGMEG